MHASKIEMRNTVRASGMDEKKQRLLKTCKDFEAVFVYQMLKSMRHTVQKCDLFHGGEGEEVYQSLLDMELSKKMTDIGPGSITRMLYNQFKDRLMPGLEPVRRESGNELVNSD